MDTGFRVKFFIVVLFALSCFSPSQAQNEAEGIEKKVSEILEKMTVAEKVGQMTQITLTVISSPPTEKGEKGLVDEKKLKEAITKYHVGSFLNIVDAAMTVEEWHKVITTIQDVAIKQSRLGIPIIYGIDAIHGANYVLGGTLFPQSIAMAATRNPDLVKESAVITAYEVRAAGIPWNFNPVLGVGRSPLWPRLFETFGEDPYLVSALGQAYVEGLQGDNVGNRDKVAGCMKHYLGYSFPLSGKDRSPAWIPERMIRDIFLPPFKAAVDAGVRTVMVNSGEINGIPLHGDSFFLTTVLRQELGFGGLAVSDWEDVKRLHSRDMVADTPKEAVRMAVMAGIDMSMVPNDYSFAELLTELVKDGAVPESRIDAAVRRILTLKFELNLFNKPYPDKSLAAKVGNVDFKKVSLQAAREAMTLLKNENGALPLKKDAKVLVTGPTADLRSVLNGGWSYTWQGNVEMIYPKDTPTILGAIQAKIGHENVIYQPGASFEELLNLDKAIEAAGTVDAVIACIGEPAYCETPGNIDDLTLSPLQMQLVQGLQQTNVPVILVLTEGRPRVITPLVAGAAGILMAYLPGPAGAEAISDVLFGDYNPSGRLPITYPRSVNDLVAYDHKPIEVDNGNKSNSLYTFGHGLSYTTFEYSHLMLKDTTIVQNQPVQISVIVKNTGQMAGKEIVELYLSDLYASVSPAVRRLKRFTNVWLEPGEHKTIEFVLDFQDLAIVDRQNKHVVEPGEFKITVSDLSQKFVVN